MVKTTNAFATNDDIEVPLHPFKAMEDHKYFNPKRTKLNETHQRHATHTTTPKSLYKDVTYVHANCVSPPSYAKRYRGINILSECKHSTHHVDMNIGHIIQLQNKGKGKKE